MTAPDELPRDDSDEATVSGCDELHELTDDDYFDAVETVTVYDDDGEPVDHREGVRDLREEKRRGR
jgi:hypothetical protein